MSTTNPRLLIVEDEIVFRDLLHAHLAATEPDIEVLQAGDGMEAWQMFKTKLPDFCIVDLHLPQMDGVSLLNLFASHSHSSRVLVLTGRGDTEMLSRRLPRIEHLYWLEKGTSLSALDEALAVLLGRSTAGEDDLQPPALDTGWGSEIPLTPREKGVLALIASGLPMRQIAASLGISVLTAQTHRRNIMRKLGLHTSTQLSRFAFEHGLAVH